MTAPSRAEDLTTGVTSSLKSEDGKTKKSTAGQGERAGGKEENETGNKRMSFNLAIRRIRPDSPLCPASFAPTPDHPSTRRIYPNRGANYDCFRSSSWKPSTSLFIPDGRELFVP